VADLPSSSLGDDLRRVLLSLGQTASAVAFASLDTSATAKGIAATTRTGCPATGSGFN
jgi:hypothetical protein